MAANTYTGQITLSGPFTPPLLTTFPGDVTVSNSSISCQWTVASPITALAAGVSATLTLTVTINTSVALQSLPPTIPHADVVLYDAATPSTVLVEDLKILAASSVSTPSAPTTSNPSTIPNLTSSASSEVTSAPEPVRSTPASPTGPNRPKKTGYNVGELTGTAVGCFIGGLMLAALAACLFMRRKSRKRNALSGIGREMSSLNAHGEAVYLAGSKAWASHLPQSESDGAIRSMANRTLDQIEMYVENFYKDMTNTHLSPEVQSKIAELDSGHLPSSAMSLLPQSSRPTVLIKHCIANLVFSRIAAGENSAASFLPRDFSSLQPSSAAQRKPAFTQALSAWRVLTAYLRTETEHDHAYQSERDRLIADAAQQVCHAFAPWARSTDNARFQTLVSIMKRASDLGIMLFSQPSGFQWQWHAQGKSVPSRNDATKIVVLPGLYKTTDQDARPLSPPLCLIEPRLGALAGR